MTKKSFGPAGLCSTGDPVADLRQIGLESSDCEGETAEGQQPEYPRMTPRGWLADADGNLLCWKCESIIRQEATDEEACPHCGAAPRVQE